MSIIVSFVNLVSKLGKGDFFTDKEAVGDFSMKVYS